MVATPQKKPGVPRTGPVAEQNGSPCADHGGGQIRAKPCTPGKDDSIPSSVQSTPIKSPATKKTKVASPIPCPVTEVVDDSLGGELNVATRWKSNLQWVQLQTLKTLGQPINFLKTVGGPQMNNPFLNWGYPGFL